MRISENVCEKWKNHPVDKNLWPHHTENFFYIYTDIFVNMESKYDIYENLCLKPSKSMVRMAILKFVFLLLQIKLALLLYLVAALVASKQ